MKATILFRSIVATLVLLHVCALHAPGQSHQHRPNLVLILADDLGWQDVGYAGAEFYETPHIDRLAAQGMTFTAAYSGGPNCSPTRACLMSGTYTPRHQIYTPGGKSKGNTEYMRLLVPARERKDKALERRASAQFTIRNSLDPSFVCIPEVLKPAGYTTARLGKWHLGDDTQGFDLSSANGKGGPAGSFYGNVDVAEQLTGRAVQFIEDNRDSPFFLYLPHWDVHTPHRAREDVVQKYRAKLQQIPEENRGNFHPVYAAMIEAVDTSVGRVVARVDELGIAERTLIIFSSDNGGLPGVSQLDPLRGQKGSLFEAGVRVPTCMRWTGAIAPGSTCDTPITSVDLLPTFASLAGAELPTSQPVDGADVSQLFFGNEIDERSIFWHYPLYLKGLGLTIDLPGGGTYSWRGFPCTSLRQGDWKLIEFHEDNSVALYNLKDDPGEENNLAQSMSELTARLRAELDSWQAETKAPIPAEANPDCILSASTPKATESPGRTDRRLRESESHRPTGKRRKTAPAIKQKSVDFNHPPREYETLDLCGWSVFVEKELQDEAPDLAKTTLARLEEKLGEAATALPTAALPDLRKVRIFVMYGPKAAAGGRSNGLEYYRADAPKYHDWLDPRMSSSIVIHHAENYASLSEFWALKALVHEFGHAQHLEHWPEDRADIYDTWDQAMKSGLYEVVQEKDKDKHLPNYAAQNHLEYFAELTAMYFVGTNYFPDDRAGLKDYDPDGYALIQKLWGVSEDVPSAVKEQQSD